MLQFAPIPLTTVFAALVFSAPSLAGENCGIPFGDYAFTEEDGDVYGEATMTDSDDGLVISGYIEKPAEAWTFRVDECEEEGVAIAVRVEPPEMPIETITLRQLDPETVNFEYVIEGHSDSGRLVMK